LGEDFDINSTSALGSTAYDISTRNDLYGGQLGARYRAGWERFNWDITAKAGAFGNQSSEQQSISNVGGIPIRNASDSSGQWAFVGDIGANLTYRLGPRWSLRGGYNLMWVEGVALAPNQLDFTDNPNSGTNINHNGGVFYYGAHAGIGCNW
jgi:outer membrane scaffolding protein for murein synthesis (MipA/OmpV family)